jgi:hypothetical protein
VQVRRTLPGLSENDEDKLMGNRWYTSLIGKYSSLAPLVDLLRKHQVSPARSAASHPPRVSLTVFQVDNYFIKSIKQAKTARWILGWSHATTRLPDVSLRSPLMAPTIITLAIVATVH